MKTVNYPVRSGSPRSGFLQTYHADAQAIRAELHEGLSHAKAFTSAKYFYDELGSKLFEAICLLPEYYPTRTEAAIFERYSQEIARSTGRGATLIDLGAGNCAKAARLFPALQPLQYVPVDISIDFLRDAVESLRQRFPQIAMFGVGTDFSSGLVLPEGVKRENRLFFYPGSSIGNFTPDQAALFLSDLRMLCQRDGRADGGVLIGIDLIKDHGVLEDAYDDSLGVTAAFNLNVLRHLNALLGADFDVQGWRHRSYFNEAESRIEMHLLARRDVTVTWQGGWRRFAEGEGIHTENSYKYTQHGFLTLLERAGFGEARTWTDAESRFMVCHARAV